MYDDMVQPEHAFIRRLQVMTRIDPTISLVGHVQLQNYIYYFIIAPCLPSCLPFLACLIDLPWLPLLPARTYVQSSRGNKLRGGRLAGP